MTVSPPSRLVIVAPNWLGDAVMALPLVADLQRAWPQTRLAVAARGSVAALFTMVDGVSEVVTLTGGGGFAALPHIAANAEKLRSGGFDAALLLPNSFLSAWTVARSGIPERWGFRSDGRRRLLTRALKRPPKAVHQAAYYQALANGLGVPVGAPIAHVMTSEEGRRNAQALLARFSLEADREFVAMAPGAAYGRAKQWPPERFAEVAATLAERGVASVVVGAGADAATCREVASRAPAAINLCGETDLAALVALFARAKTVIANDSGAMHLASAAGTRVIAIFGATNEQRTSPLAAGVDAPSATIVATSVWCRPCMLRECPIDHRCMTRIAADDVIRHL